MVAHTLNSSLSKGLSARCEAEPAPRVVIVDESAECREVLHTLLESRGVSAVEACRARDGLELVRRHHPEVVVLDLDVEDAVSVELQEALECESRTHDTKLVVLGKAKCYSSRLPDHQCLAKPYHYAPLIRTIERLLLLREAEPHGVVVCDPRPRSGATV